MIRRQYISALGVSLLAFAMQASAQESRGIVAGPLPASSDGPTLNSGRNVPVPDLLNMKGGDRPLPLKDVGIEQRLGTQLPMDATFRDENGQTVQLGSYFGKRPVVLALVYYECPMLCTQILNGLVRAAKVLSFKPGQEYDVVAISFDARETPKQALVKKAVYVKAYGHEETAAGWHFLTGTDASIKRVTEAVGFHYKWDVHIAQFAHASAIYVDAGRQAFQVFLRNRLFTEGYAPRVSGGVAEQDRNGS